MFYKKWWISKQTCLLTNTWCFKIKKDKGTDYALSWKSKRVFNSKLNPLYTTFVHSIKPSGYRIGIKFDADPLAVEQSNYLRKNVNVCIGVLAKKFY